MATDTLQNEPAAATSWDEAFAAFVQADRECDAVLERLRPVEAEFMAEREKIPHKVFRPDPYTGRYQPVSTRDMNFVAEARYLVRQVAEGRARLDPIPSLQEHFRLCQKVAAADGARQAEIEKIDARLGYSALEKEYDEALDRRIDARDVLIAMPAPNSKALLWKLEWLFFEDSIWDESFTAQTIGDARRMLGGNA